MSPPSKQVAGPPSLILNIKARQLTLLRKVIYAALNFGKPWPNKSCRPQRDMTMKRALMVMLLGVVMPISSLAQGPPRNPGIDMLDAIAAGPTDPKEFEAWMDQFLADYLKRTSASLGFVLVKDGKIFFQKGYGYADAEKKTPVIPDQTLFYAASVSKLVTATAVMQLVEQGKLEPDADVNTYLERFQLENNYPAPVTVANLLTHTSGIDDSFIVGSVDRPSDLVSLGDFFTKT